MVFINKFCEMLRNLYPINITQEEFEIALRDEEFIEEDSLLSCFACSDENQQNTLNTHLIEGKSEIFKYIESKIMKYKALIPLSSYVFKIHFLQYAKDWLYSEGYFEDSNSIYDTDMKAIVCNRCGSILGFIIKGNVKYPYLGYLDDAQTAEEVIAYDLDAQFVSRNHSNDNINYNDFIKVDNIKNINKNNYRIDLLKKLDENKIKLNEMVQKEKKDPSSYLPLLYDTLRKMEELNEIL